MLWRTADQKGANVPLLSRSAAIIAEHDGFDELPMPMTDEHCHEESGHVPRPIGLRFQFLEVCGGAGKVTSFLAGLSIVCGPVLDLSTSLQYNLIESKVLQWVIFMLESHRLDSFLVAPPCASFSPAAHPCVRSYREPRGFQPALWKTWLGNRLAFAAIALLFVALRLRKLGLGEQPRRSKMRWLEEWRALLRRGAREVFLASCSFGSPHQKEFCFVGANMQVQWLDFPCTRDHTHVKIEGKFTRPSATYTDGLAECLAIFFRDHIQAQRSARTRLQLDVDGLEDVVSNDYAQTLEWEELYSWKWKGHSHINLLETASTLRLFRHVGDGGGDCRFNYLGDSHVSRSALARGRTSSVAMRPLLRRAAVLCLGFGLYPAGRFCPTRLNPGDAPSRCADIEPPVDFSVRRGLSLTALTVLAANSPLRRWASNWCRLVLLLNSSIAALMAFRPELRSHPTLPVEEHKWCLDFDSALGFPGEGWTFPSSCWLLSLLLLSSWWIGLSVRGVLAMVMLHEERREQGSSWHQDGRSLRPRHLTESGCSAKIHGLD